MLFAPNKADFIHYMLHVMFRHTHTRQKHQVFKNYLVFAEYVEQKPVSSWEEEVVLEELTQREQE